jgi:ArsR family transcriptional regulator
MTNEPTLTELQTENAWEDRATLLRVMAHPVRLAILDALCRRPHCVKHINSLVAIPQPHLSQHMAALRKGGLVACHACGPVRCYYVLRPTLVRKMVRLLRQEHPPKERDCRAVVREARRGLEQLKEADCREQGPPSDLQGFD